MYPVHAKLSEWDAHSPSASLPDKYFPSSFQNVGARNALLMPDICNYVLDYLVTDTSRPFLGDSDERAARQALAVLARTCRALSELALDALWYSLHSVCPLLQCSRTKDNWHANNSQVNDQPPMDSNVSNKRLHWLLPINEEEWGIMLRYSSRVRELSILATDTNSPMILQLLSLHAAQPLPNLRRLFWSLVPVNDTKLHLVHLLLNPSLTELNVDFDVKTGYEASILEFVDFLHTFCRNLKNLRLGFPFGKKFPRLAAATSHAVCCYPNLRSLWCDEPLNEDAFFHLSKLCHLQHLTACLPGHNSDLRFRAADHLPFENMRLLDLTVEDLSSIIPFLRSCHQPFEDIIFTFMARDPDLPSPKVFHDLFTALDSSTRRQTLQHIMLVDDHCNLERSQRSQWALRVNSLEDATSQINFEVLSPLSNFRLRSFAIELGNSISLNDNELARLVQAWPDLEMFRVNMANAWRSSRILTLRGLLRLLAHCPKLHDLAICVDARIIPLLMEDESRISNKFIKNLYVADSPIEQPVIADVAQFLSKHFPSLQLVRADVKDIHPNPDLSRMWAEVRKHVNDIRAQRDLTSN